VQQLKDALHVLFAVEGAEAVEIPEVARERIEIGAQGVVEKGAVKSVQIVVLEASLASLIRAVIVKAAKVAGDDVFLQAVAAVDDPLQAGETLGHPGFVRIGGLPVVVRGLHQLGEDGRIFTESNKGFVGNHRITTVTQIGGTRTLLAGVAGGSVRLLSVGLMRGKIAVSHGGFGNERHKILLMKGLK
jgi:hypothetical protein